MPKYEYINTTEHVIEIKNTRNTRTTKIPKYEYIDTIANQFRGDLHSPTIIHPQLCSFNM